MGRHPGISAPSLAGWQRGSDSRGSRESTQQPQALQAALDAGRGILSLPCGYGKTTVSLAIASRLGWRTMVIVHKEFLAQQWIEED